MCKLFLNLELLPEPDLEGRCEAGIDYGTLPVP